MPLMVVKELSEVYVHKKVQYSEVKDMYSRSFNTLKLCTYTQTASIQ